jgi:hypothetical protein
VTVDTRPLRVRVFESMDNAKDNGYDQTTWTIDAILDDIMEYDGTLENVPREELEPHVKAWLAAQ